MSTPHHRRSIRLPGYDYASAGAYFITLLVHHREPLFGALANGKVQLGTWGRLAESEWQRLPARFPAFELGAYVIMPDHLHGILWIHGMPMPSLKGGEAIFAATQASAARQPGECDRGL